MLALKNCMIQKYFLNTDSLPKLNDAEVNSKLKVLDVAVSTSYIWKQYR